MIFSSASSTGASVPTSPSCWTTTGQVIATSDPALKGKNFGYRPYFHAAMKGDSHPRTWPAAP